MNPILQAMTNSNNILGIISSLKNGNPDAILNQMLNNNPQFRQFMDANKGKSPEQIAQENGIDMNMVRNLMR